MALREQSDGLWLDGLMMTRIDQLKDAISRCEARLKIAERNSRARPSNERARTKLRNDFERAREDLRWIEKRYEEAMGAGSSAFRREA